MNIDEKFVNEKAFDSKEVLKWKSMPYDWDLEKTSLLSPA